MTGGIGLTGVALAALSLPLAGALAAAPRNDFRVVVNERIGPYRDYLSARYPAAVQALGSPTARGTTPGSNLCTVRWAKLGLDLDFVIDLKPCAASHLRRAGWYLARIHARRWVVDRGLRVGDPVSRLRRLYPKARLDGVPPREPTWTLRSVRGDNGPVPVLTATVWDGKVTAIDVFSGGVF